MPLQAPGDDATLARHVGAVMSRPLPVDRPWWSVHLMSGYRSSGHSGAGEGSGDTGAAMVVSIHHGLADGVSLDHLFHALSDEPAAEGTPALAAPPRRSRPVHDVRLLRREVSDRARSLAGTVRASATPEGARSSARPGGPSAGRRPCSPGHRPRPTDDPDPDRRVERMRSWMSTIKRTNQALATFAGTAGAGHGHAAWTQALVHVTVTSQ